MGVSFLGFYFILGLLAQAVKYPDQGNLKEKDLLGSQFQVTTHYGEAVSGDGGSCVVVEVKRQRGE